MYDLEDHVFNVAMTVVTMWIIRRFWGSFFEKKKRSVLSVSVWILFWFFQMGNLYSRDIHIGITCINVLFLFLIAVSGYICDGKGKYFLLVIFSAAWSLVEFFVFFMISSLKIEQENSNLMGMVISELFMIVFVYTVSVYRGKTSGEFIPNIFYPYLLIIPLGSIYIAICEFYAKSNGLSSMFIVSTLFVLNVVVFELYIRMNEVFMHEKEKAVYAQQLGIISENTMQQQKIMEEFHAEKHDLVNELIVLKESVERNDQDSAIRGLNKLIHNCRNIESVSDSGNRTVDAVINFKYAAAREYGIDFRLNLFIPDELPIEQCDIGVVLGNAIDNAVEAVKECKSKEKLIEISMGVKKGSWVMVIKNPYEHEIKKDRTGRILSTKQEKSRHGYGLKSIMRIAEEYQGEVVIETENGVFSLTVVLNLGIFDS